LEKIVIALAGQPNVGKSSLINAISNAKLKVGNFSGVTVDKTEVEFTICDDVSCKEYAAHIIDLPGAYSLTEYSQIRILPLYVCFDIQNRLSNAYRLIFC